MKHTIASRLPDGLEMHEESIEESNWEIIESNSMSKLASGFVGADYLNI